ncbi:MAG: DUF2541 family protein [Bacteriovoracaceae bacterium]|jgi:hypothetical protein|nr:DUF2541 family protein [Bacteriovoracaceae bacterium]
MKLAALILGSLLTTTAFAGPVLTLGTTSLLDSKDVDTLKLGPCLPGKHNKKVVAFKLKVFSKGAEVDSVKLTFFGGGKQKLKMREFFAPGTSSRWINLKGGARCIRKIVIKGDSETLINSNLPMFQSKIKFLGLK